MRAQSLASELHALAEVHLLQFDHQTLVTSKFKEAL